MRGIKLKRAEVTLACAIGSLAVFVGISRALHDALWQDEVASARVIDQPTALDVLHQVRETESTPPLWYLLAWLGHHLGLSITELRLVSLGLIALTAGALVLFARRMMPLPLAGLVGLLVAVGSQFVTHGRELRAYALLVVVALLFAALLDAEVQQPSRKRELGLAVCVAAGLMTHYFFALTVGAAAVWLWLEPEARRARKRTTLALLAGIIAFVPVVPLALSQYHHDRFWWIGPFVLRAALNTPFRLFSSFHGRGLAASLAPPAVLLLATIGAVHLGRRSQRGRLVVALGFIPLLLAAVAWSAGLRVFATRNLIETGPFFAIVIVGAVAALPRRAQTVLGVAVAVAAVAGYVSNRRASATPFNQIASALTKEGWHSNDPIAVYGNFFSFRSPLEWYLPGQPPLALARPTLTACRSLFLVVNRTQRTTLHSGIDRIEAGPFVIERLPAMKASGLRGAIVLADPFHPPQCTDTVTTGRYSAAYGLPEDARHTDDGAANTPHVHGSEDAGR